MVVFLLTGVNGFLSVNKCYSASDNLRVVWLIIDRLSLAELTSTYTPNIDYMQQTGAFSLMNVRTAGHLHSESTYLSANTGKRCQGSKMSYNARTYGKGAINDEINQLKILNRQNLYQPELGFLGKMARESGITIGVLGNCDTRKRKKRTVVSMFMDEKGYIPRATINKDILLEVDRPWGYQTNWNKMEIEFDRYSRLVDALVIETGDISRIEDYRHEYQYTKNAKKEALEQIDNFVGYILKKTDQHKIQIGIIVPTPPETAIKLKKRLSWVLFSGRDIGKGWLSTTTTRRKGIITIQDLPFIFLEAALEKKIDVNMLNESTGNFKRLKIINAKTSWKEIEQLNQKISFIYRIRPEFIKGFIILQLLIIIMAIVKMLSDKFSNSIIFSRLFEYLLLALMLVPLNYMIISRLNIYYKITISFILVIITLSQVVLLSVFIKKPLIKIVLISWIFIIITIQDLITGYKLLADSILGYSSIIGARFYGLGNEYMGFFLGAMVIAVAGTLELLEDKISFNDKHLLTIPFFVCGIYLIGATNLGANFGGMVTALIMTGVTYFYLSQQRFLPILTVIIIIFSTILFLDISGIVGQSSHMGRAIKKIIDGEWQWIANIIIRKLSINLKLLRWTIWSRVLLAFIIYLFILARYPVARIKEVFLQKPYLKAGFYGTLSGCLVTIVVNDSGVVAAATLLFYPLMSLLFLESKIYIH